MLQAVFLLLYILPVLIVLSQGFHWESSKPDCRDPSQWPDGKVGSTWYSTVKDKVKDMREAGFTDIWLPPPYQSVSQVMEVNSKSKYLVDPEIDHRTTLHP
jgi:hypothetical protein